MRSSPHFADCARSDVDASMAYTSWCGLSRPGGALWSDHGADFLGAHVHRDMARIRCTLQRIWIMTHEFVNRT